MRRSARRNVRTPDVVAAIAPQIDPGPEQQLEMHEARVMIENALGRLDTDQRAVLVMHDIEGLSAPAIAATLSAPLNTVYSRLRLARAK